MDHQDMELAATESEALPYTAETERRVLRAALLAWVHQIFHHIFIRENSSEPDLQHRLLEYYAMDSKIIQLLILGIMDAGDYTIEGIAYHTHLPVDVVYDAASGLNQQLSITPWARVVEMYLQVRPDIAEVLADKLLKIKRKKGKFSALLT